ncbi:signal recognition particle-docking protein FtsY [Limosilactobacillus fermentum]|uniref:signal recognition particle-docking protein FtsY n=1 Tax=Limosilactobacillus fermentum TaxID=1613 RepID=UPI002164F8C2|nr:signal recognition particle-docking protein FtsY [Limosilactobacillus fermentum]UVW04065.1 signal recognition particle-docking protein FtsY [Limosilactobacillus fermentum]WEN04682.1 signal recognition particle-docking protein FtsY [Limosilactobacillus fermentum]WEN11537.1 signal recognition particle-docking protein FtsY [Limosilactobacillus fermentum]WJD38191.1 signal recognition particle-docking protein FtsY [Limosilactobacillus fermentum]
MGLFDIFRRKKREEVDQSTEATAPVSAATSPQDQAPVAEASSATTLDQPASEKEETTSAAPVEEAGAETAAPKADDQGEVAPEKEEVDDQTPVEEVVSAEPEQVVEPSAPAEESASAEPEEPVEEAPEVASAVAEEPAVSEEPAPSDASDVAEEGSDDSASASVAPVTADWVNQIAKPEPTTPASPTEVIEAQEELEQPQKEDHDQAEDETEKKYDQGLEKSRNGFGARLNRFLANFRHVDEDFFDDLEDMLIESDVGYEMAMKLSDSLREEVRLQNAKNKQDVSNVIIEKMVDLYDEAGAGEQTTLTMADQGPTVIMFVGVNGAGKTTTIGKMAARFKGQGKRVLLAAADTFRAGATEQLEVWAQRDGVDIVTGPENSDPAAVVFDAVTKAKKDNYDVLFVDTAGRLQNKVNLMNELAKMKRILTREIPDAPHEVLLVLDATTGQNALTQAKLFKETTDVTGIVLTKLDGTARGGIVLAIRNELHLPVKFVGLGEKVSDLEEFNAQDFVYGLFKGLVTVD